MHKPMHSRGRKLWPIVKTALALVIVAGVGWQFVKILRDPALQSSDQLQSPGEILWEWIAHARPGWLLLSACLYLIGLGFSNYFWLRLLRALGQSPSAAPSIRAYYIGHLGKYVPGKAWALLVRTTLSTGPGVRPSAAALTATYETLTTMASGALLAAVLFTWQAADTGNMTWRALGLLALAGIPILPGVFNLIVRRVSARFSEPD